MSTGAPYVGLDIGTTKVAVVVAATDEVTHRVDIIGAGLADCDGLKLGVVSNIQKTADAVRAAVEMAEQKSGYSIGRVYVGVSGNHVATSRTKAIVTVSSAEITQTDIRRLHHELAQVRIAPDRRILHVIPQDYVIDEQDGISDPLGMTGKRLEANGLVVTASANAVENLYRCADRAGLDIEAVVLQPLASAYAVLDDAEKEVGVALVDIGGGTTDVAVFKNNVLRSASIVAVAGQRVTDDIMTVLAIRNVDAERIKKDHGHADGDSIMRDEVFQVPGVAGRTPTELTKSVLCQIIEPRVEEIYELVLQRLMDSQWAHQLSAGIVLTGGCSMLRGTDALAHRVFRMPVAVGIPRGFSQGGLAKEVSTPVYSTAVGLALYGLRHGAEINREEDDEAQATPPPSRTQQHVTKQPTVTGQQQPADKPGFLGRVKEWFENL
ncbi:MAG: cell division protein FtsA [Bradyrhizobiaceae bacterium]|nr:cell division protein FtsA [Bradyrhizobiaceae bacterium]